MTSLDKARQQMNAELWIQYLEVTKLPQGRRKLGDKIDGYCCMGVGCVLHKINFAPNGGFSRAFGLRVGIKGVDHPGGAYIDIADLNDHRGLTFKQIAAELRRNPKKYFTWAQDQTESSDV